MRAPRLGKITTPYAANEVENTQEPIAKKPKRDGPAQNNTAPETGTTPPYNNQYTLGRQCHTLIQ